MELKLERLWAVTIRWASGKVRMVSVKGVIEEEALSKAKKMLDGAGLRGWESVTVRAMPGCFNW